MPINIYPILSDPERDRNETKPRAYLCDDDWNLCAQLIEFERWLESEGKNLPKGEYVADIGFSVRSDACFGGGSLSVSAMAILVSVGIKLFFSEYPGVED